MEIFKREDAIKRLLLLLDIPQIPFFLDHEQGIGPYEPDFFDKRHRNRQEREELAERALQGMVDEDLWELCETPGCLKSFAFDHSLFDLPPWYAGGFGVCVYKPDYEYWAKMDYWTVEEATCLSLGFKPEGVPDYRRADLSPYATVRFFKDRMNLIERAQFKGGSFSNTVAPGDLIKWALSKKLDIPAELSSVIGDFRTASRPAMLSNVDGRKYDTALKVILGLIANLYGEERTGLTKELKEDVAAGLALVGLNLDRKTLNTILGEAVAARQGFVDEQKMRDERQS